MNMPGIYSILNYKNKVYSVEWYDVDGLDALPDVAWQQAYVIGHSLVEPNTLNDRICYGNVGERIVAMVQGDFEA